MKSSLRRDAARLPVPDSPPVRLRTDADLRALQRFMVATLRRGLTPAGGMRPRWVDGRPMQRVAAGFMKGNDRLTPFERLEIYNQQYWYRLLDSFREDSPGLYGLLGPDRFWKLAEAYLTRFPSRSYTLRNLCRRLPAFIRSEPKWTRPDTEAALDLARFEWAQVAAFDEASRPPLSAAGLKSKRPETLRVRLQPFVTLLSLGHAVDDYLVAVKQQDRSLRGEASNAVGRRTAGKAAGAVPVLKEESVRLVVHRSNNQVYFKRLPPREFRLLRSLAAGHPLAEACASAYRSCRLGPEEQAREVREAFTLWGRLGWLCSTN